MIIQYTNGEAIEGLLLARTEKTIRVATPGEDEVLEFTCVNGTWVSEDCEPVRIEFAWQRKSRRPVVTEADCICRPELAARLIHLLWSGEEECGFGVSGVAALALDAAPWQRVV